MFTKLIIHYNTVGRGGRGFGGRGGTPRGGGGRGGMRIDSGSSAGTGANKKTSFGDD